VLPLPRRWSVSSGRGPQGGILRLHPSAMDDVPVRTAARELGLWVREDPELGMHCARIGKGGLPVAPDECEGYALAITSRHAAVSAPDRRGLVWGLGTLAQLADAGWPCCEIRDWPAFPVRYHHDDVSRKQISTPADFRRIIRHLARFKFSHYTLYLEDMLLLEDVPQMGEGRGGLTPDEVRAIVAEGAARQIEVFPTISLAGHQENLLMLPRYAPLAARTWQSPSSFDPAKRGVREHLARVIGAACALFPSRFFHMGFDELIGLDADGFVSHANWCAGQLVEQGKTPLLWADMIHNHFGCDLFARLHPAIIPVAWDYEAKGGRGRKALADLLRHRPQAWVLGGYNNWTSFVHAPLAELDRQWAGWAAADGTPSRIAGFGAAQWGDLGYENHRDFCWALFAAFAERAWSGADGNPKTVEERFQRNFYGHPMPELTALRRLLESGVSFPLRRAWQLHRLPAPGWIREARGGRLPVPAMLAADLRTLSRGRRLLAQCRRNAVGEAGHLEHFAVALDRLESVVLRARAAIRMTDANRKAACLSLKKSRASYRRAWFAHNRAENIECSLAVFDSQMESWRREKEPRVPDGFHPLDLSAAWNACVPDVAGVPIGLRVIDGVPFRFAGKSHTHIDLEPGKRLVIGLPGVPLADLHIVATSPRDGEDPLPAMRLRLTARERVLYEEDLLSIRHLCDWWAPLGDHIWAGGGFRHVDPQRVRHVLSPNPPYGLTAIHRFPWPGAPQAEHIELEAVGSRPIQIFAITAAEARRW
jgi:hypothetical protein